MKKNNRFAILINMKYYIVCYIHFIVQLYNCIIVLFPFCYVICCKYDFFPRHLSDVVLVV